MGSRRPRRSPTRARSLPPELPAAPLESAPATSIPHFTIDLDAPAEVRWAEVATTFRARFDHLLQSNGEALAEVEELQRWIPAWVLLRMLPASQRADVRALAELLGQPLPLMSMLQLAYEAFSLTLLIGGSCGCTALLQDDAKGPVHARTLDWAWFDGLEQLLVDLSLVRGGRLLYRSTTFVGFVGVLTAMRAGSGEAGGPTGGFSLALNYRRPFDARWVDGEPQFALPPLHRNSPLAAAARHALLGGWPAAALLRHVVESADGYAAARSAVRSARLIAPCYVTICGARAGEGAVITRCSGFGVHEQSLPAPPDRAGGGAHDGALCVANVDCFGAEAAPTAPEREPVHPDAADAKDFLHGESWLRRDLALTQLRKQREASSVGIFEALSAVMQAPPIANEATIHVSLMCPATGVYMVERSIGPALLAASRFEQAAAVCRECCACDEKTALMKLRPRARWAELPPGSLLRRLGGGYYCARCLPLTEEDLRATSSAGDL